QHIVPVFGVGEDQGVHYFAMQYIDGQGLDAVLDELRRLHDDTAAVPVRTDARAELSQRLARGLHTGRFPGRPTEDADGRPESGPEDAEGSTVLTPGKPGDAPPGLSGQAEACYFRRVAEVGARVARALAYAHGQGVLHRDVKPSNLLLDRRGHVWVTDFGL